MLDGLYDLWKAAWFLVGALAALALICLWASFVGWPNVLQHYPLAIAFGIGYACSSLLREKL